jgi:hypothetical protein
MKSGWGKLLKSMTPLDIRITPFLTLASPNLEKTNSDVSPCYADLLK